nr:MAG TPA: DNA directed DNA polymerase [Caudoviricetes sp.]
MLIDKEKIAKAKQKIGIEKTWEIAKENLHLEKADDRNFKACCPFHNEDTPSFILNPKTMSFKCFGCGKSVDLIDIFVHSGDTYMRAVQKLFELADIKYSFGELGLKKERAYRYPHPEGEDGNKERVYAYLEKRGISRETVDKADITQDAEGNVVFNYFDENDVLCMCKYRPSRKIDKSKGDIKTWCQKDADTTPLLFHMNKINPELPLVISEGEGDALSIIEGGWNNVVSVPFGAGNTAWIEHNFDWLEQFDSIIICSDNDEAGVKMRKEVIPRLGSWRTKYIDIPKTIINRKTGHEVPIKDMNEVLYYAGKEAVLDLIEHAEDPGVPSIVNVSEIQDVDLDEMDGINTGIRELDAEIMRLFYGTLTVVSGLPASGKTSFLSQIACQSLEQNKPVWMFSREMPSWMEKNWLNYIMAGGHHINALESDSGTKYYKIDPSVKAKINAYYDKQWFLYRDDWSNTLDDLLVSMEDSVRKYGVKLLILDNLMTINIGSNENNDMQKQTDCINKLIKFAMKYLVAVVLVAHPRKLQSGADIGIQDISGSANITNLAHRTIGLRRIDKDKEKSNHDVVLTLIKDRMRGRSGKKINLYYDIPSRRFYTNESEYEYKYGWDSGTYAPLPYPHAEEHEVYGEV